VLGRCLDTRSGVDVVGPVQIISLSLLGPGYCSVIECDAEMLYKLLCFQSGRSGAL